MAENDTVIGYGIDEPMPIEELAAEYDRLGLSQNAPAPHLRPGHTARNQQPFDPDALLAQAAQAARLN